MTRARGGGCRRSTERCGCSRVDRDTWAARPGDEVESQCLALSLIAGEPGITGHLLSLTAYEDDCDPIDCIEVLLGGNAGSPRGRRKES